MAAISGDTGAKNKLVAFVNTTVKEVLEVDKRLGLLAVALQAVVSDIDTYDPVGPLQVSYEAAVNEFQMTAFCLNMFAEYAY